MVNRGPYRVHQLRVELPAVATRRGRDREHVQGPLSVMHTVDDKELLRVDRVVQGGACRPRKGSEHSNAAQGRGQSTQLLIVGVLLGKTEPLYGYPQIEFHHNGYSLDPKFLT